MTLGRSQALAGVLALAGVPAGWLNATARVPMLHAMAETGAVVRNLIAAAHAWRLAKGGAGPGHAAFVPDQWLEWQAGKGARR